MWSRRTQWLVAGLAALVGCAPDFQRIAPARDCRWEYQAHGLPAFRRFAETPALNPTIHISRRGLTARVVGVLPDEWVTQQGGMLSLIQRFPWVTSVSQTTQHYVTADDPKLPAQLRQGKGIITRTQVIDLPANAVMIVYPVSRERPHLNTLAGNWWLREKQRQRHSQEHGAYGGFPFLRYSDLGHALHGPIDRDAQEWGLHRGRVSAGCQRMEGEHIIELSVLLGCSRSPPDNGGDRTNGCPRHSPPEKITVMEDYDFVPDPLHAQAASSGDLDYVSARLSIQQNFVAVDTAYPRLGDFKPPARIVIAQVTPAPSQTVIGPTLPLRQFATWDNRQYTLAGALPGSCLPK